jgi:long-chain acyl-CoA synthetase
VPTLLERVRRGVEDGLAKRGGPVAKIFARAWAAWLAKQNGEAARGGMCLGLARIAVFPAIRKRIGANLRALICGSAPLARDTQLFFIMLGIPVLQVYGLTETTGICTMDIPGRVEPGWVGPAVPGVEMKLGDNQEILVRGPNVFPGYWSRPEETGKALRDGWFHSGDQGEVNANGNWRIVGRIKNLLILNSGHNVAPEPIEEKLLAVMTGAQQVVLVGHGRSYLVAIVTGDVARDSVAAAIEGVNQEMPHYKRIHGFHVERQAFTIDSGLLTALGKLKRDAIGARYAAEIEMIYRENSA